MSAPVLPDRFALLPHIVPAAVSPLGRTRARPEAIAIGYKSVGAATGLAQGSPTPPGRGL